MTKDRAHQFFINVFSVLAFFLALELVGRAGLYETSLVPLPSAVVRAAGHLLINGPLFSDLLITVRRIATGFIIGSFLGLTIGLITGLITPIRRVVEPLVQLGRPIPAVALVPLALAWFGIGEVAKATIVAWACFFPTWINTHSGVRRVPIELVWTAAVLGAKGWRTVAEVIIPWASPFIFVGLRTSIGLAFAATVVAEMSGASGGLGYRIIVSHYAFRVDDMLAAIIVIGILGAIADLSFQAVGHRLLPWLDQAEKLLPK